MESELFTPASLVAGSVSILISIVAFFVIRHFNKTDRLALALEKLNTTLTNLSSQIERLQEKDAEKSKTIDKLFGLVERLSSQVGKLREAYVGLKTSVEICQQNREDCVMKGHHQ